MFKDVFISYAKEDIFNAEQLFDFLGSNGYSPWLDKKKLKPGANWNYEIKKALKESTFVIILLSSTSVKKRGYVQKEFRYALEYSENKLIDDIYIIPVLIDKCDIPEQLSKFQWIEADNINFNDAILNSLNTQRQKYLSSLPPDLIDINQYSTMSIDLKVDLVNKIDYHCELPLFHNNSYFDAEFVNTFIQQKALEEISNYRSWIYEIKDFIERSESTFYISIHYNVHYLTKEYLSLSMVFDSFIGGAHPTTTIQTLNFKFNPDTKISLRDLVEFNDIKVFLEECIDNYGIEEQKESLKGYLEYINDQNLSFTFNEKNLEIDFINIIPRVIMAIGSIEVPLNKLKLLNKR